MGGIYGGKDIRPISQKQDSLHGLINTILDKLPLGVFVKDAEDGFRYLYWNRFMEEITGIGTEEVGRFAEEVLAEINLTFVGLRNVV